MHSAWKLQDVQEFDKEKLLALTRFLISNFYIVSNNEFILRQVIGIPMGTNSGPQIANLVLYAFEVKYMLDLYKKGDKSYKDHAETMRFIDDGITISVNGISLPPTEAYGNLEYSRTTKVDEEGNFIGVEYLGAFITKKNGRIDMSVIDKQEKYNMDIIKFPEFNSNCPYHQTVGIVMGQLSTFRNICNSYQAFKQAVTNLVVNMLKRRHPDYRIMEAWRRHMGIFKRDTIINARKLKAWFHRMIHWAQNEVYHSHKPKVTDTNHQTHDDRISSTYSPISSQYQSQSEGLLSSDENDSNHQQEIDEDGYISDQDPTTEMTPEDYIRLTGNSNVTEFIENCSQIRKLRDSERQLANERSAVENTSVPLSSSPISSPSLLSPSAG